jgi:hypothetical protein
MATRQPSMSPSHSFIFPGRTEPGRRLPEPIARRVGERLHRLCLIVAVLLASAGPALADAADSTQKPDGLTQGDSAECMRCHWMETMAYRDRETRKIVDLSVDRDAYRHSVHAGLACRDCHARGYKHYPHRTSSADEALHCVGCHAERGDDGAPDLSEIGIEYQHSVHAMEGPARFDCFSCHDPHRFKPLSDATPIAEVVTSNNAVCLDCHESLDTPVPKGHEWLPRPRQHWASVRCIDCHTPIDGRDLYRPSHVLLSANESNQNCVECHTRGSALLSQLYNYRLEQEREEEGFFSQALYNDAYIIGMSRSPVIDGIGLAVIALMIIGIAAHGFGRYLAYRKWRQPR